MMRVLLFLVAVELLRLHLVRPDLIRFPTELAVFA
jgi:hypothetical protein